MPKSFYFLGDLIDPKVALPVRLFGDFILNKADEKQILIIRNFLEDYFKILAYNQNKFESAFERISADQISISPLDKKDWKYYVIEHEKHQGDNEDEMTFALSKLDLTILFEKVTHKRNYAGTMYNQLNALTYLHDIEFDSVGSHEEKVIDQSGIDNLEYIHSIIINYQKNKIPFIDKALTDLLRIKEISNRSPFKILSYFSILELLVTTTRNRNINDSSISNQLQKKLTLINNQAEDKIVISNYFKGPDTLKMDNIISKLYQYRSDIAHGNVSDFEKELQIFKGQTKIILPFLDRLTKLVLVQAMRKPSFILDLKDC